jgi:hypothetical protein
MRTWLFLMIAGVALGADKRLLPGQAGNDNIELAGSVIIERDDIHQALGADLGANYIVVRMKATPKTESPLRISPDDFTLISRKDGEKSEALSPTQIAGKGALVVKSASRSDRGHGFGVGGFGGGLGSSPGTAGQSAPSDVKVVTDSKGGEGPLLAALKAKALPDRETQEPLEGLLYFPIEGKVKPKDLSLIYKGPAGKLVMDFK